VRAENSFNSSENFLCWFKLSDVALRKEVGEIRRPGQATGKDKEMKGGNRSAVSIEQSLSLDEWRDGEVAVQLV